MPPDLPTLPELQTFLLTPVPFQIFVIPAWYLIAAALAALLLLILSIIKMRPKYYFFIRHGQTINNAKRIRQGAEGGLTESGIKQAERTGVFLKPFHIRRLYASPFERTRQTAEIVAQHLHVPIHYSQLLVERRNPREVIGKSTDDPAIRAIADKIDLTFHDDNFRYSDEENFMDLKRRAHKALRYLSRRPGHRIGVVTHGIFLKMLVAHILYPRDLHATDWVKLAFFSPADNAGMTLIVYRPWHRFGPTRGWGVLSYNITIPTEFSGASGYGLANLNDLLKR